METLAATGAYHLTLPVLLRQLAHELGALQLMAADMEGWLAPNRIYPGVADAMRALMAAHEVYIVTTKQARFTEAILRQMAGISFPPDRIFSQTVSGRVRARSALLGWQGCAAWLGEALSAG